MALLALLGAGMTGSAKRLQVGRVEAPGRILPARHDMIHFDRSRPAPPTPRMRGKVIGTKLAPIRPKATLGSAGAGLVEARLAFCVSLRLAATALP